MHHGDVSPEIGKACSLSKSGSTRQKFRPPSSTETINVAIWNIREFGKVHRTLPAQHYIAEILGQFDLIAIVELRDDLTDFGCVLQFLGPSWDVVYSDWLDDPGGNSGAVAFLYDRRRHLQWAGGRSGRPARQGGNRISDEAIVLAGPYMCSFRAGNFDFIAIATHARWGDSVKGRQAELQMLADWIDTRFKDKFVEDHDLIVMGDFNVPKIGDKLFKALTSRGLQIPDSLLELKAGDVTIGGSNFGKNARFDQILHLPSTENRFTNFGGTVDFFGSDARIDELFPGKNNAKNSASSFPTIFRSGFRSTPTSMASGSARLFRTARKSSCAVATASGAAQMSSRNRCSVHGSPRRSIAVDLPVAGLVVGEQLDAADPFGAFPGIESRHDAANGSAMLGGQRLPVVHVR